MIEIRTRIKQRSLARVLKQFTLIHQVHCQIKSLRKQMINKALLSIMNKMEATGHKSSLQKESVKKRKIGRAILPICLFLRERNSSRITRIYNYGRHRIHKTLCQFEVERRHQCSTTGKVKRVQEEMKILSYRHHHISKLPKLQQQ